MASCVSIAFANDEADKTRYRIELDVVVNNPVDAWRAAFSQTLARTKLTAHQIVEAIGPSSDIHLLDCLYLLANPAHFHGCEVTRFEVNAECEPELMLAP